MFREEKYTKPHSLSLLGAVLTAGMAFLAAQYSPILGYWLALMTMLVLIIAMYTHSIWPTQANRENKVIFSLFWGLILGTLLPFLIITSINEGISGIVALLT